VTALILVAVALDLAWWVIVWRATRPWRPLRVASSAFLVYQLAWVLGWLEPAPRLPSTPILDAANVIWHGVLLPLSLLAFFAIGAIRLVRGRARKSPPRIEAGS